VILVLRYPLLIAAADRQGFIKPLSRQVSLTLEFNDEGFAASTGASRVLNAEAAP
jgi:hypothetical protein